MWPWRGNPNFVKFLSLHPTIELPSSSLPLEEKRHTATWGHPFPPRSISVGKSELPVFRADPQHQLKESDLKMDSHIFSLLRCTKQRESLTIYKVVCVCISNTNDFCLKEFIASWENLRKLKSTRNFYLTTIAQFLKLISFLETIPFRKYPK